MSKKSIAVSLAFCLLCGIAGFALRAEVVRGDQPRVGAKSKVEYRAVKRTEIEDMAPERVKKNGRIEGSNTEALTAGLNTLAKQGWELVAIEPYSEKQSKSPQGVVTYRHFPTYIFKRPN